MKENKSKRLMISLVLVSALLLGLVVYMFVLKPVITGYATNAYNGGVQDAVISIMQQAESCQPIPLTFEDQTSLIIKVGCPGTEAIVQAIQQSQQAAPVQ